MAKTDSKKTQQVGKNDMLEVLALRPREYTSPYPVVAGTHPLQQPDARAQFAMLCVERWAMVAAEADGEDSAGRAKVRRMTPGEVAAHACVCTDRLFAEFAARGWIVTVPIMAELIDKMQDVENGND